MANNRLTRSGLCCWVIMTSAVCLSAGEAAPAPAAKQQSNDTTQPDGARIGVERRKEQAGSSRRMQSDEVRAFRDTALDVSFPSQGLTLRGWMYRPAGAGPFPAVIWNHGSERQPRAHPELGMFYTRHGFVLFLPVRHGHEPSPGRYIQDVLDEFANGVDDRALVQQKSVELHDEYNADVVAAVEWMKTRPFVDADRIAISGCSYGGIQTLLAAEQDLGVRACVSFAPAAISWANTKLRDRLALAARGAKSPVFLLQARNDYSIGPSETLGPLLKSARGTNRSKIYPPFGTTPQEGHGGFATWEEGIAIWGDDVVDFLRQAGLMEDEPTSMDR